MNLSSALPTCFGALESSLSARFRNRPPDSSPGQIAVRVLYAGQGRSTASQERVQTVARLRGNASRSHEQVGQRFRAGQCNLIGPPQPRWVKQYQGKQSSGGRSRAGRLDGLEPRTPYSRRNSQHRAAGRLACARPQSPSLPAVQPGRHPSCRSWAAIAKPQTGENQACAMRQALRNHSVAHMAVEPDRWS